MRHWLMKTEPSTFGLETLAAAPRRTTGWDGVRNYQVRNMIRDEMKKGDLAFLYHSSCALPGIVATMKIVRAGYPDPTAFDRKDDHYDPDSDPADPRWYMVDVQLQKALARPVALEELRAHAHRELKDMVLLRPGNRLSITPVAAAHWKFILALV
ncbi:MAG TPA: EVE domain-containing protein [Steroidobacteraceae bacterium]|jgi:predicted RNA-binding protein with PUA-like domain